MRWSAAPLAIIGIIGIAACGQNNGSTDDPPRDAGVSAEGPIQPEGWDDDVRLTELPDLDPAPDVVRVRLEAKTSTVDIGLDVPARGVWTYDGTLPGPLIRANVGDRVIIEFTNSLPSETTIHWHGLRVPANMDGVPGHSQPPVPPGGTFTYDFVVPDAGLFWYHPHVMSAAQTGFGLYGALSVDDPDEEPMPGDEVVLVLSDIALDEEGRHRDPEGGGNFGTLFGREGDHVLVNGKVAPVLKARAGAPLRLRMVDAAKSRYFQLALEGHTFLVYGADVGRLGYPVERERLLIIPGERREVVVVPNGAPGEELTLQWIPYDRGYGSTEFRDPVDILRIQLDDRPPVEAGEIPRPLRSIPPIDTSSATHVDIRLTQMTDGDVVVLGINGVPYWDAEPFEARVGETQVWSIENEMEWAHPFHLHGFLFQVLDDEGAPIEPMAWRDTVDVPVKGRAKFVVRYDDRPGMWMFHCHILDHADAGMMGMLRVDPR